MNRIGDAGFMLGMFLLPGTLARSIHRVTEAARSGVSRWAVRLSRRLHSAFHWSQGEIGADSALYLASRCHGRSDPRQRADSCGDDGHCGRLHGGAIECVVCAGARFDGGRHRWRQPRSWRRQSLSFRTTSNGCWRTLPSASWAICFSHWASVRLPPAFSILTHAFFKALLFLGAGTVIHAMGGEQDMRKMGALPIEIPTTYRTMLVAVCAIAGIPPLAGFLCKDEILWESFAEALRLILWARRMADGSYDGVLHGPPDFLTFWGEPHVPRRGAPFA